MNARPLIVIDSSGSPIIAELPYDYTLDVNNISVSGQVANVSSLSASTVNTNIVNFTEPSGASIEGVVSQGVTVTNGGDLFRIIWPDGDAFEINHVSFGYDLITSDTDIVRFDTPIQSIERVTGFNGITIVGDAILPDTSASELTATGDLSVSGDIHCGEIKQTHTSSLPISPVPGQQHFDTSTQEWFYWDDIRSKWLSMTMTTHTGGDKDNVSNLYLAWADDNVPATAANGVRLPYDAVLVGMTATQGVANTGDLQVQVDGSSIYDLGFVSSTHEYDYTINEDIPAHSTISMYMDGNMRAMGATIFVRRTLT